MIKHIEIFNVKEVNDVFFLYFNEKKVKINGDFIEGQYEFFDYYLIFVSDDILYEMGLHIYFLDHSLNILDYIEISAQYATDKFDLLYIEQPDKLIFSFLLEKEFWKLKLMRNSKLSIQLFNSLVKRKNILINRVYMELKKEPAIAKN